MQPCYKLSHLVCFLITGSKRRKYQVVINDVHPLHYSFDKHRGRSSSEKAEYDSKGFGAGGLAPLKFAHMPKNWVQGLPDFLTEGELLSGEFIKTGSGSEVYRPGMGLSTLPRVNLQSHEEDDGKSSLPRPQTLGKRLPSSFEGNDCGGVSIKKKKKLGTVPTPSSSIQSHTGGKGLQRVRAKQVLRG